MDFSDVHSIFNLPTDYKSVDTQYPMNYSTNSSELRRPIWTHGRNDSALESRASDITPMTRPQHRQQSSEQRLPSVHTLLHPPILPPDSFYSPSPRSPNQISPTAPSGLKSLAAKSIEQSTPSAFNFDSLRPNLSIYPSSTPTASSTPVAETLPDLRPAMPSPSRHEDMPPHAATASPPRRSFKRPDLARKRSERRQWEPNAAGSTCLGTRDFPGKGLCYVYEDGTTVPAIIDGEQVNPSWGITKAGKPRKRLAQACQTCREKKIKCDPGVPKCSQCTKARRPCRGGPDGTAGDAECDAQADLQNPNGSASEHTNGLSHPPNTDSMLWRPHSPTARENGHKAIRAAEYRPLAESPATSKSEQEEQNHTERNAYMSVSSMADKLANGWNQDPSLVDPTMTIHLIRLYLKHINTTTYSLYPDEAIIQEAMRTGVRRDADERMLGYAMLALGALFSDDLEERNLAKTFAGIATHAATERRMGHTTIYLAETRLLLALYYFSQGKVGEGFDWSGQAIRSVIQLGLHTEEGIRDVPEGMLQKYNHLGDATRPILEEFRRRMFWSVFLMDRMTSFCGRLPCMIKSDDVFIQLPWQGNDLEFPTSHQVIRTPYLDNGIVGGDYTYDHAIAPMGWLVQVASIWGDVLIFGSRATHMAGERYGMAYDEHYDSIDTRMSSWRERLPEQLHFNNENLFIAIEKGYAGAFISINVMYHVTMLRLNRHVRVDHVSRNVHLRSIHYAYYHALELLKIAAALEKPTREAQYRDLHPRTPPLDYNFTTPFAGYSFLIAIDVLTSRGTRESLLQTIRITNVASTTTRELEPYWWSAGAEVKAIEGRLRQLTEIATDNAHTLQESRPNNRWRIYEPLDCFSKTAEDALYGATDDTLFDAIESDVKLFHPPAHAQGLGTDFHHEAALQSSFTPRLQSSTGRDRTCNGVSIAEP